ncbi:MAG: flagellar assembly protein FliW [Planctomycetales bacterium]|nr:flagellar assembly protein FliW [Planctomycetales bacterium]
MKVTTTRFGEVKIEADDILLFRSGLIGFEDLQHWVVLADGENDAVAWLQSMNRPEIALPVISPRRFIPSYQVHVEGRDVDGLQLNASDQAYVLCVVSSNEEAVTANLRAPIVINLDRRLGCQVITTDEQSLQHEILPLPVHLRRTA